MPVTIIVANIALLAALVLYSVGAWGAFRAKAMSKKHVTLIITGVVFDVVATAMMAIQAGGVMNDLHTYLAFTAMFGMIAAGVIGAWALSRRREAALPALSRWTLLPWALWIALYVWAMVTRMGARVA